MSEREALLLKDIAALLMDIKEDLVAIRRVVAPDVTGLVELHEQLQNLSTLTPEPKKGHDYGDGNV